MSKYQKLDSTPTMHDDDYDESFSLYSDDNQQQLQQQHQLQQQQQQRQQQQLQLGQHSDHIRLNFVASNRGAHMSNGNPKYHYNNSSVSNNNSIDMSATRTAAASIRGAGEGAAADTLDLDMEHTWEVPLLRSSSNSCTNLVSVP